MRHATGMVEVLLRRRGRGRSDLYALSVLSFAAMGYRALGTGGTGVRFAPWAVAAILIVLLIANLEQGGWFRRSAARPSNRARRGDGFR
ncbi:MAG TPA: hypothetical protein VHG93_27765 [Longimicrobium sp.]|nr:hypothetical protein [Longimicrobium sp.]